MPSNPDACRYERLAHQAPPPPGAKTPGGWYVQVCPLPNGGVAQSVATWISDGVAPNPAVLAMEAVARLRLPLPAIRTNPATTNLLVRIPVWVWHGAGGVGTPDGDRECARPRRHGDRDRYPGGVRDRGRGDGSIAKSSLAGGAFTGPIDETAGEARPHGRIVAVVHVGADLVQDLVEFGAGVRPR
jgi:hypothetical protein